MAITMKCLLNVYIDDSVCCGHYYYTDFLNLGLLHFIMAIFYFIFCFYTINKTKTGVLVHIDSTCTVWFPSVWLS